MDLSPTLTSRRSGPHASSPCRDQVPRAWRFWPLNSKCLVSKTDILHFDLMAKPGTSTAVAFIYPILSGGRIL